MSSNPITVKVIHSLSSEIHDRYVITLTQIHKAVPCALVPSENCPPGQVSTLQDKVRVPTTCSCSAFKLFHLLIAQFPLQNAYHHLLQFFGDCLCCCGQKCPTREEDIARARTEGAQINRGPSLHSIR